MLEIRPPTPLQMQNLKLPTIFLGGCIELEMDTDWQSQFVKEMQHISGTILNPLRKDWDDSWGPEAANPQFSAQVHWELDAQEIADVVIYRFLPDALAPITLLEMGLFAYKYPIIYCPQGFWRKGNVDIVCQKYGLPTVDSWEALLGRVKRRLVASFGL